MTHHPARADSSAPDRRARPASVVVAALAVVGSGIVAAAVLYGLYVPLGRYLGVTGVLIWLALGVITAVLGVRLCTASPARQVLRWVYLGLPLGFVGLLVAAWIVL